MALNIVLSHVFKTAILNVQQLYIAVLLHTSVPEEVQKVLSQRDQVNQHKVGTHNHLMSQTTERSLRNLYRYSNCPQVAN